MSRNVLIVGPSWVGDMVMAQALAMTLADRGDTVDLVAPAWSQPLIARMPQVRNAIALPVKHREIGLANRWSVGKSLRANAYEQVIVLPRSIKAALVPFFARIPKRTGYLGEHRYGLLNDIRPLDKALLPTAVQRYVALGLEPGAILPPPVPKPSLRVDPANTARLRAELGLGDDGHVAALMPGAEFGPSKQWPFEYFGELVRRFAADGMTSWILGSEKDRAAGDAVVAAAGGKGVNLCGKTRLEDSVDLIAEASVAVSNDSGLMHIAAAVGSPVVVMYGSTPPDYMPPVTDRAEIIFLGLDCSPCKKPVCPLEHHRCLRDIPAGQVYAVGKRLIAAG